ncbi:MAG TPA: nicotinate (nicotinamide) nucleotide adenylyltransferase [Gemmatimonadales bacterium]
MRIGVLGGSFDPIHNAHLIIARAALEALALDAVRLVVAATQPFKEGRHAAPPADRLRMVELAVDGVAGLVADGRELARPGPSYTIDTLRELRAEAADTELVLLMGSDTAAGFSRWREPEAIRSIATIGVFRRPATTGGAAALPGGQGDVAIDVPLLEISSTAIRERAARGRSLAGWVHPAVADYIVASQLYGSGRE